jgi:hypothetical protein
MAKDLINQATFRLPAPASVNLVNTGVNTIHVCTRGAKQCAETTVDRHELFDPVTAMGHPSLVRDDVHGNPQLVQATYRGSRAAQQD